MTTRVTPEEVRVWFGWVATFRRAIRIDQVRQVEAVRYSPIAEYGGWGIRSGPRRGDGALDARGDRGVRLELIDGARLLIGSQRPEELAAAIRSAMDLRPIEAANEAQGGAIDAG